MDETPLPASPCTGICRLDPLTKWCQGCRRTLDEIGEWPTMGRAARVALMDELRLRREQDELAGRVVNEVSLRG